MVLIHASLLKRQLSKEFYMNIEELTEEEILEELSSSEAVEVSMIESAANELGQVAGLSDDLGFVENEDNEFFGSYCISIKAESVSEVEKDLLRLGYEEVEDIEGLEDTGFIRGRIVVMLQSAGDSIRAYLDYDDFENDE